MDGSRSLAVPSLVFLGVALAVGMLVPRGGGDAPPATVELVPPPTPTARDARGSSAPSAPVAPPVDTPPPPPPRPVVPPTSPTVVAVRTVGAAGPVEGVDLDVAYLSSAHQGTMSARQISGADGVARLTVSPVPGATSAEYFAEVVSPLGRPVRVPIALAPPPTAPVDLPMPPTGSVLVRLVGPDGTPWTTPAAVRIAAAADGSSAAGWSLRVSKDGVARFPVVGLGVTVDCSVHPPAGSELPRLLTTRLRFAGPTVAGQEVAVTATTGGPQPRVVGRLVDANGTPLAGQPLGVLVAGLPGAAPSARSSWFASAADGRFDGAVDCALPASGATLRLGPSGDPRGPDLVRRAWTSLDPVPLDLGDVVVARGAIPRETLVAGRVARPLSAAGETVMVHAARRRDGWWDLPAGLFARCEDDGSFVIRGAAPDGDEPLFLLAQSQNSVLAEPVEFRPGRHGVALQLAATGGLGGSVLLPPGVVACGTIDVTVEGEPARTGGLRWGLGDPPSAQVMWQDASFWCPDLRPGTATVVVRAPGRSDPLVVIRNVEVAAGGVSRDSRSSNIDLTRFATTSTITVTDDEGRPVAGADVRVRPVVPPGTLVVAWQRRLSDSAGVVSHVHFGGAFDVVAMAPGCAASEVRGASGSPRIVLRPASPSNVTVRLAAGVAPPPAPLRFQVRLVFCGDEHRIDDARDRRADPRSEGASRQAPIAAGSPARLVVGDPGRWQAVLYLAHDYAGGGAAHPVSSGSSEANVTSSAQELEIEAAPDPAMYARAVRELTR